MELREVLPTIPILDEEIRLWEARDSRTEYTRHYIAHVCGAEVGFLSVDVIPEHEYFVIYKVFVPPRLRRQGFGSQILEAAEMLGKSFGYCKVLLNPHTLADEFSQPDLESWYRRSGYLALPESHDSFTKNIC